MLNNKIIIPALIVLLLTGCQQPPTATIEAPTAQVLHIDVTPATSWIIPEMDACQKETIGVNLIVHQTYARTLVPGKSALILSGQPLLDNSYAVEIVKTGLIFIVNPTNSVKDIPLEMLQKIFSGRVNKWSDVDPSLPDEAIQVWMPPTGDEVWDALNANFLDWRSASDSAWIASEPKQLLTGVSADKYAIGILPKILLDQSVKALDNQPEIPISIIALTQTEPEGLVREFLLCLQASQLP